MNLRADWPDLPIAEKRVHIERILAAMTVLPAGGKRNVPVKDRLILVPVPDEEF